MNSTQELTVQASTLQAASFKTSAGSGCFGKRILRRLSLTLSVRRRGGMSRDQPLPWLKADRQVEMPHSMLAPRMSRPMPAAAEACPAARSLDHGSGGPFSFATPVVGLFLASTTPSFPGRLPGPGLRKKARSGVEKKTSKQHTTAAGQKGPLLFLRHKNGGYTAAVIYLTSGQPL